MRVYCDMKRVECINCHDISTLISAFEHRKTWGWGIVAMNTCGNVGKGDQTFPALKSLLEKASP